MHRNTHSGPQLQHMTEKQLFSTGPMGWLSARLLMTSIWGNHRFPVALIKSRLIKMFAIHPALTLQVVFFFLFSLCFDCCWSFVFVEASALVSVILITENNWDTMILHPLPSPVENSQTAAKLNVTADA